MKKTILVLLSALVIGATTQSALAGDREWAVAGKVLTGIAAAAVISAAVQPAPVYTYSCAPAYSSYPAYPPPGYSYSYCPPAPAVVYTPAPVIYRVPVVVRPVPVVSFRFSTGGGYHPYRRGCW